MLRVQLRARGPPEHGACRLDLGHAPAHERVNRGSTREEAVASATHRVLHAAPRWIQTGTADQTVAVRSARRSRYRRTTRIAGGSAYFVRCGRDVLELRKRALDLRARCPPPAGRVARRESLAGAPTRDQTTSMNIRSVMVVAQVVTAGCSLGAPTGGDEEQEAAGA